MADERIAQLSVDTAQRLVAAARRVEGEGPDLGDGRGPRELLPIGRYAKVITCADATQVGTIQFCTGNRNALVVDTSVTVKCGMDPFPQANDFIVVMRVAAPDIQWEYVRMVTGARMFKDPATDGSVLASQQDNPAVDVRCTDTVTIP